MKIDLSNLKEIGSLKSIKQKINLPKFSLNSHYVITPNSFQLNVKICNSRDIFVITGSLTGDLPLECSRCLKKFQYHIECELAEEIKKREIKDFSEVDLTDIFIENILLQIPIKPVCSDSCKGLCPICGQDLNTGQCDCKEENIDLRLAKLKEFVVDDN